jgi:hypothetical protein
MAAGRLFSMGSAGSCCVCASQSYHAPDSSVPQSGQLPQSITRCNHPTEQQRAIGRAQHGRTGHAHFLSSSKSSTSSSLPHWKQYLRTQSDSKQRHTMLSLLPCVIDGRYSMYMYTSSYWPVVSCPAGCCNSPSIYSLVACSHLQLCQTLCPIVTQLLLRPACGCFRGVHVGGHPCMCHGASQPSLPRNGPSC